MYPKDPAENKKYRLDLLTRAENDPELQAYLIKKCEHNPLFFVNTFCWTHNPRLDNAHLPFITYEFQDKYISNIIECIDKGLSNCTEKSRDMGFSWQLVVITAWAWRFKGWSSLYGSYKESYVDERGNMDSFFERVRYVLARLPKWMKPDDMVDKYMSISSKSIGADIAGDAGANFGTGGRRKFVIMDEFALWRFDAMAFRKTKDVTNCRIIGGTPEGKLNIYGKLMTSHKDYKGLNIKRFRLHWREHPLKTQEWYEKEKTERTALDIAKELDISYDDSVTGAVYKDFSQLSTFGQFKFNPNLKVYTSWDFGRDMTPIIWFQKDFRTNQIYIIDAYQREDKDIDFFQAFVTGEPTQGFTYTKPELEMIERHRAWKHMYAGHYGDPYNGDSRSGVTQNTFKTTLAEYGINVTLKRGTNVSERINKTTLALRRININEELHDFIEAIGQSRYPQVKEGSQATSEKFKPVHDANSHYRTALEYFCDNEPQGVLNSSMDMLEEYYR